MKYRILDYIKKHEALLFIVMTYLFTWIIWGGVYISKKFSAPFIILGTFMPTIVSIVLTGFLYKGRGIKKLLMRLIDWRHNPAYYIFVIGLSPLMLYIIVLVCRFMDNRLIIGFDARPSSILSVSILTLIFGGPLGEEVGWRGFFTSKAPKKLSPLKSVVIIGIVWACWHIPLFFILGTPQYGTSFLLYIISVIDLALIISWVFNRTNGSLIFPILFHTSCDTAFSLIYGSVKMPLFELLEVIFLSLITILIIIDMIKNTSRKVINNL